jgi:predicted lipoprotein
MAKIFKPLVLVSVLSLILSGCGESTSSKSGPGFGDGGGTIPDNFDEAKLIANLTDNVITPTFEEFVNQTNLQSTALTTYCNLESDFDPTMGDSLAQEQVENAKKEAQQTWENTASVWQQAELMQLGPLSADDGELRNRIYSWPSVSKCNVDQDVAYFEDGMINNDPNRPYDISKRVSTRRGIVAIEHLLFSLELNHNCSSSAAGEALSDWNSRTDQERRVARCRFSVAAAKDLTNSGNELLGLWTSESGYANELKNAGQPGNSFESTHKAVNVITDAMFYTDSIVKDKKLAVPLGKFANSCGFEVCAEDVESYDSGFSLENIKANLVAFEKLFLGNLQGEDALTGFDDFLVEEGASDTKDIMIQGINDAKNAAAQIETDLKTALISENEKVEHAHAKVKDITDQLKNDFINKLALELPKSSAGDND